VDCWGADAAHAGYVAGGRGETTAFISSTDGLVSQGSFAVGSAIQTALPPDARDIWLERSSTRTGRAFDFSGNLLYFGGQA